MKIAPLAISAVLLIASLFGVSRAYSHPTETSVTEEITLLDYEHQGRFDYLVSVKPSHLYGPEPQEPPPPPPETMKYPAGIVELFNVSFSYSFVPDRPAGEVTEEVEVRAIMVNPSVTGTQEVVLLPKKSRTGDFTVSFPVDIDYVSDDNITIGDNISGRELVITAYVYATLDTENGPFFESFSQSLPIRSRGPILEVENVLDFASEGYTGDLAYEQHGEFSYDVYLKPDSGFGGITLKPPPTPTPVPPPTNTIGPESVIMARLIEDMHASFSYHLDSSVPIAKPDETVMVQAVLENPGKWLKTFELVPLTGQSGDFTVSFPLDLAGYSDLFSTIQQETGGTAEARSLAITARVHTKAKTDYGTIDESFVQTLSTDLTGDVLTWSDNLTGSQAGSIKTSRVVLKTETMLGLPVSQTRVLLVVVAVIVFLIFGFCVFVYLRGRRYGPSAAETETLKARKKYRNIIVETREMPEVKQGETVVLLDSLDDLVRTAESLLKPVLHKTEGRRHIYCVLDASTRYEYHLNLESPAAPPGDSDHQAVD